MSRVAEWAIMLAVAAAGGLAAAVTPRGQPPADLPLARGTEPTEHDADAVRLHCEHDPRRAHYSLTGEDLICVPATEDDPTHGPDPGW